MLTTATLNALAAYNLPTTVPAQFETTTPALFAEYKANVGFLGQLGSLATPYTETDGNAALLNNAVTTLINRLQNGDGNGNYYSIDMANNLNYLLQSLTSVGIKIKQTATSYVVTGNISSTVVPPPPPTTTQWNTWRDLLLTSNILQPLLTSAASNTSNRNLQAMVELDYVGTGNRLLSEQLTNLQQGINVTQTILNTLGDLQQAHNNIVVANKPTFSSFFNVNQAQGSMNSAQFEAAYRAAASAYFNAPIIPAIAGVAPAGYSVANVNVPVLGLTPNSISALNVFHNSVMDVTQMAANAGLFGAISTTAAGSQSPPAGQEVFQINNGSVRIGGVNYSVVLNQSLGYHHDGLFGGGTGSHDTFTNFDLSTFTGNNISFDQDADDLMTSVLNSYMIVPKVGTFLPESFTTKYGLESHTLNLINPATGEVLNQFLAYTVASPQLGTNLAVDSVAATKLSSSSLVSLGIPGGYQGFVASQLTGNAAYTSISGTTVTRTLQSTFGIGAAPTIKNGDFVAFSAVGLPGKFTVLPGTGNGTNLLSVKNKLVQLLGVLSAQIPLLSGLTPGAAGVSDQTTLLARVRTVYNNLADVFKAGGSRITTATSLSASMSGLTAWLLDKYNMPVTSNNGGIYQSNITSAVTAAQSLNSQQQNNVRNFLFVFQEYQQSASSILQQLTQIIERMAQGIK